MLAALSRAMSLLVDARHDLKEGFVCFSRVFARLTALCAHARDVECVRVDAFLASRHGLGVVRSVVLGSYMLNTHWTDSHTRRTDYPAKGLRRQHHFARGWITHWTDREFLRA